MYTESELIEAIDDLNNGAHTINNVAKLASIYTVLDHISIERGYSTENRKDISNEDSNYFKSDTGNVIGDYGDTEFLSAIKGKNTEAVWMLIDELMYTLKLVDDALYYSVMRRIDDLT